MKLKSTIELTEEEKLIILNFYDLAQKFCDVHCSGEKCDTCMFHNVCPFTQLGSIEENIMEHYDRSLRHDIIDSLPY